MLTLLLSFLFLLTLNKPFFAQTATPSATINPTPTPLPLTISNIPSQITAGQQFNVVINLHSKLNLSYQFKVYGGVNGDNYSYEVKNGDTWINGYNGAWNSLPQSLTDNNGNCSVELTVRFKTEKTSGTSQLIAKVKESASNNYIVSNSYNIDVIDPPTIPTPTNTPTNIPTPTKIPTLTPTKVPTPTIKLTPTKITKDSELVESTVSAVLDSTEITEITDIPTITPTAGEILGESTKSATKKNFLPLIFIVSGGILLLAPLIASKIKKQ